MSLIDVDMIIKYIFYLELKYNLNLEMSVVIHYHQHRIVGGF